MFEGIRASQLARVWVEARRAVGLSQGGVEGRVIRMLVREEEEWRSSVAGRKKRRARARKELERFVRRYVGVQQDAFDQLSGKDITRLVIKAVRMAIRCRRWGRE